MINCQGSFTFRIETSTQFRGNGPPEKLAYIDMLAKELASESCTRCSGLPGWKSTAMMYEGLEWKYYYCYECRRWSMRHFRYRYAIVPLDDPRIIGLLLKQLELRREMYEVQMENISWVRRKISAASMFFQRFLP